MRIKIYIACVAAAVSFALRLDAGSPQRQTTGDKKDIDIVVKKHPTGSAMKAQPDPAGNVMFKVDEPGT